MDERSESAVNRPENRVRGRWANTAGGKVLLAAVICVLLAGVSLWVINQGSLPEHLRTVIARELTEALGVPVSVDDVDIGIRRVVLHGVHVESDMPVSAKSIAVGLTWWNVAKVGQAPLEALRWVEVEGLRARLPEGIVPWSVASAADMDKPAPEVDDQRVSASGQAPSVPLDVAALLEQLPDDREVVFRLKNARIEAPVPSSATESAATPVEAGANGDEEDEGGSVLTARVNGNVVWKDGRLMFERMVAHGTGWELILNGPLFPRLDVYARVASDEVADLMAGLPFGAEEWLASARGRIIGEAWLTKSWASADGSDRMLDVWGRLHVEDLRIEESVAVDEATVQWTYRRPDAVDVHVEAVHRAAKLVAEGTVSLAGGALGLAVDATDVDLSVDVPVLARWNVDGRADFSGTVTGSIGAPVLTGTVASDGGHLFGQPVSTVQGFLELSREHFSFQRARVTQGTSAYYLEGLISFASAAADDPGHLDMVVRTDHGRAETLTAVLGWDVPVQAGLAGTLTFEGPLGSIGAEGDLALTHGVAYGQPFDHLAGRFRYGDGAFSVVDAEGAVRGGAVKLSGGGPIDGEWGIAVDVDDVPLQALSFVRDRLPTASGLVQFDGTVVGSSDGGWPAVSGEVVGRHVHVGNAAFAEAVGRIAFDGGRLTTEAMHLKRFRGGTYTLAGAVGDTAGDMAMDLSVEVTDESVADLLAMAGLSTPIPVASGKVDASVRLQGAVDDPEAHIRIHAPDVSFVGRRTAFGLELRIKDGRIEVENLERAAVDGPQDDTARG